MGQRVTGRLCRIYDTLIATSKQVFFTTVHPLLESFPTPKPWPHNFLYIGQLRRQEAEVCDNLVELMFDYNVKKYNALGRSTNHRSLQSL